MPAADPFGPSSSRSRYIEVSPDRQHPFCHRLPFAPEPPCEFGSCDRLEHVALEGEESDRMMICSGDHIGADRDRERLVVTRRLREEVSAYDAAFMTM